jgi:colicin import membrane protein
MKLAIASLLGFLGAFGASVQAQPSTSPQPLASLSYEAQRARIEEERGIAQAQFDAAAILCYQKFAVNDCLREARNARRDVLADVRRRSLALRDAQALQKAQERVQGR